jgi:hypothetical protein
VRFRPVLEGRDEFLGVSDGFFDGPSPCEQVQVVNSSKADRQGGFGNLEEESVVEEEKDGDLEVSLAATHFST